MILLVGGEKGGSGKSTLATNVAVWLSLQGKDVLLLDADRQGTAAMWATERASHEDWPAVQCVQRYGNLFPAVKDLAKRYDEVVIDAGGRDSEELRTAMAVANNLYTPLRASQADLWTAEHMNQLLTLARALNPKLKAHAVLSIAPTNPRITEAREAAEMLIDFRELCLSKAIVRDRKVFRDAMLDGRGVMELTDEKAREEIETLAREIYG